MTQDVRFHMILRKDHDGKCPICQCCQGHVIRELAVKAGLEQHRYLSGWF